MDTLNVISGAESESCCERFRARSDSLCLVGDEGYIPEVMS